MYRMALVIPLRKCLFRNTQALKCCFATSTNHKDEYTHFGYESIKKKDKPKRVNEVFTNVASKYDLMNDLMSCGIHRIWKDRMMKLLNPNERTTLLDSAGGTGDIAFRFVKYVNSGRPSVSPSVTVCDINQEMLNLGENRSQQLGFNLKWVCCSADDLPFQDNSFNAYTIAFGIRNCTDIAKVLKEAHRVLTPGGRFVCLEFSEVTNPILRRLYDSYSFQVIPVIGEVVAGDWKSYQYLSESIRKFPKQNDFADMIYDAGFKEVTFENLTFGVCAIHSGFKL